MDEKLFVKITKRAHKIAKQMKIDFPDINYRAEFIICFKMLYEEVEKIKKSVNIKIKDIIKKENKFKTIKMRKKEIKDKFEENNNTKNIEKNKLKSNEFNKHIKNKQINSKKESNYIKGSKHLIDKGEIEILNVFKDKEIEMIEYIFVNSGIVEVTTKVTLVCNILKHTRRKELQAIDTYKIDTIHKTIKEEVEIREYTYLLPTKIEKN
ncbi:hypothetical protein [Clostridium tarantellae]|uniref:Uncharacterized protein n=1 Tax=Clostridium tarantellae TaxID=39493 RepID=A0A6I1MPW2_9CLOT|nr:hypothetical protein [Clostridium tarantellae]MPQ44853.1 hypothetical protein [Clostridium tarantellae]